MYEKWIDQLLENKLKVKTVLHLGTEFELTRFVDAKGKQVDPFVPAFDIMKVKNFNKEKKEAQLVNVDSPRFISTLERALVTMFKQADKDNTGKLSYQEFKDAFKTLTYGLNENDVNMHISMADEDENEMIELEEEDEELDSQGNTVTNASENRQAITTFLREHGDVDLD